MKTFKNILAVLLLSTLCAVADQPQSNDQRAVAVVETTSVWQAPQARVMGVLYFEAKGDTVMITGELKGLEPNSVHGFHIHQYGDFSKDDGTSAGGHFDPHGKPHADPSAEAHHAGDLGNVTADKDGIVKINMKADWLQIGVGPHGVVGRSVVVHADPDDLKSQPAGNAGPRIGVGVIGWASPKAK